MIDANGILWSASSGHQRTVPALRSEHRNRALHRQRTSELRDSHRYKYRALVDDYLFHDLFYIDGSDGSLIATYPQQFPFGQGLAVDSNGHVWVAEVFGSRVAHFAPDPDTLGNYIFVGMVDGFGGTTGVAVDAGGKIWAAEMNSNSASRIDPMAGPVGSGDIPIGAIDLSVSIGAGASPYNYSDMTGFVAIGATVPLGSWTVVHDGGEAGTQWVAIHWNAEPQGFVPDGGSLNVFARAAETQGGLSDQAFQAVANEADPGLFGRFIEVRVELRASPDGESPVLSDLTIHPLSDVEGLTVNVDIRPNSCPNPINQGARGDLPVAILGTATFNVMDIDPASIRLEGVPATGFGYEDVETPFESEGGPIDPYDCSTAGPDGFMDMTVRFDNQAISAAIDAAEVGEVLLLDLDGELFDGTPFSGQDVVLIVR
jgi:hypothetical protein